MQENSELKKLNADDRRLIAEATRKSKNLVDKVLRGDRKNGLIISTAKNLLAKKDELKAEILSESITEALTKIYSNED